ncbi:MAG: ferrous iron transport protein B [Planctomycetota bacterium]
MKIAVAGNPNSGKSTVFNAITGARQHVANYPGVTVEIKVGSAVHGGVRMEVVDLPGTYSLTAYSPEEIIARDYVLQRKPDVVVNVVDASNLERNLYLTVQLIELGTPVVVCLNMMDIARRRGLKIDVEQLSHLMGITMVPTVAHKGEGIRKLLDAAVAAAAGDVRHPAVKVNYGGEVEEEIERVETALDGVPGPSAAHSRRWLASKLIEGDEEVAGRLKEGDHRYDEALAQAARSAEHIRSLVGDEAEAVMADRRYGFISGACQEAVLATVESRHILSDRVDSIVTNRILGLPILLGLMYAVFYLSFGIANVPGGWIETGFARLSGVVSAVLSASPYSPLNLRSLLVEGIIGGVGSVIVFLPNVMVLFFAIAALEDSGYMARAAFVMDRFMHKIGLHGRSFIPMVIGFGCSAPAIMATRTIENRRDRITTMLVIPLMSCSARLPIYGVVIPAFFALRWRAPVLWLIYIIGGVLAVGLAKLFRVSVLRGESHPLVMELPPYRVPTLRGLVIHMWDRAWLYVKKAGTVILAAAILLWFATNWPSPRRELLEKAGSPENVRSLVLTNSLVGRAGRAMEPALKPMGLDWRMGAAFVGAATAKEIMVAQMGIVYGVGESENIGASLREKLREDYSPIAAFSLLLYALIATPCVVTLAVTRRESGSWKWAAFQWLVLTGLGYLVGLTVYQIGTLVGIGV